MGERLGVVRSVALDARLRRLEISFAGFALAESATWLAMLVYAFERGGVGAAGALATGSLAGSVVVAPFAAYGGDRFRPDRALAVGYAAQAAAMGATATAMWADAEVVAYVAAAVTVAAVTLTRPVVASMLPALTQRPAELVAANVVLGVIMNVGVFAGPLTAAAVLSWGDPATVFALFTLVLLVAGVLAWRLDPIRRPRRLAGAGDLWAEVRAGLTTLRRERPVRSIVVVMTTGSLAAGFVDVALVTFAETELGDGGVSAGLLAAAVGLGAVAGALAATGLIIGAKLSMFLAVAGVVIGGSVAAISVVESRLLACAVLALTGVGLGIVAVVGAVALQRRAAQHVLARVFGVQESFDMLGMALGAGVASLLLGAIDIGPAVATAGMALALVVLLATAGFVRSGADLDPPPADLVERLLADALFAPLDVRAVEGLAASLEQLTPTSGTVLIRAGDVGDRYYLVVDGELVVTRGSTAVNSLGPGDAFGEVALLDDVRRTATVTCTTDAVVLAVGREAFLEAVTGHPQSLAAAREVVAGYRDAPG